MSEVDVFVENVVFIDWEVHEMWIRGLSVTEAVTLMRERGILKEYPGLTQDILVSDLNDKFRRFSMLEDLLLKVGNFSEQLLYQIDEDSAEELIEKYYGLDHAFCRELAGKKLSSRTALNLSSSLGSSTGRSSSSYSLARSAASSPPVR